MRRGLPGQLPAEPATLKSYPIDYLEGLGSSGIFNNYPLPQGDTRCGPDEYPVEPALDDLFAIKPMFYAISGASHPWYHNSLSEKLDSQVKGGNHRFDIPAGAEVAEFRNAAGTKTYQAVQTEDGLSVSYALVDKARQHPQPDRPGCSLPRRPGDLGARGRGRHPQPHLHRGAQLLQQQRRSPGAQEGWSSSASPSRRHATATSTASRRC